VVSGQQEVDPLLADEVDQSMFLGDATRPAAGEVELQRFRLSDAAGRIAERALDEIEDTQSDLAIGAHPVAEVVEELGLEDGLSPGRPTL